MPNKKNSIVAAVVAASSVAVLAVALFGTSVASASSSTAMKKCLHPKTSIVTVKEYEYGFKIVPAIPHCGTVTFKQSNIGSLSHNFDIQGIKAGKLISPHKSTSFTIKALRPGKFQYLCDVLGHASLGMTGTLTVKD